MPISRLESIQQEQQEQEKKKSVADVYNQGVEASRYYSQKTINWVARYSAEILMMLVAVGMIGIQQFAEANWDWLFWARPKFWYDFIPYIVAQWLVLISSISGKHKYLLINDLIYLDLNQQIQLYVDNEKNGEITKIANIENKERKIKKYIQLHSQKLQMKLLKYKINSIAVLEVYLGIKDIEKLTVDNDLKQTKTNHLMLKGINVSPKKETAVKNELTRLYNELQDDYIKNNIDNINIKYNKVDYIILTNGMTKSENKSDESSMRENIGKEIFSEFGVGQFVLLLAMGVLLAMDLIQKDADFTTWVFFIMKATMLLWNYIQGSFRAPIIFKNTYVRATRERLQILKKTNIQIP